MGPEVNTTMDAVIAAPAHTSSSYLRDRWPFLALVAVIVCFPLLSQSYFVTRLGVVLSLNAIMVVGMTLLIRYAGVFSMGQAAFFAIGAYMSAILTVHLHMNPWLAMGIAAAAAVFAAYLFCAPFLKLRAIMLAIATLGLATVIYIVAKNLDDITGGVAGMPDIPYLSIGSYVLGKDWQIFYLCGAFLIFFAFLADNVGRTRLGRAYHAIRSNEVAAQASGIDVQRNMRNIFCFAALVASIAGSLLAHFITFISPESFRAEVGLTLLIIVIIGGANIWAGILTTVILMGFSEASRGFQDLSTGLYALLLMVIFFVFPDGLSSVLFKATSAAKRGGARYVRPQAAEAAPGKLEPTFKEGTIMEVHNVSMYYGGTAALSDVSLSVDYGHIVGIIGPNGAGKTTLLNVINGYLMPATGTVVFQGRDVTRTAPHEMARLGTGRTFQLVNLFKGMTVIENVMVGCHLKGKAGILESGLRFSRARREEREIWNTAVRSLSMLDLMDRAYDLVDNLSFGEQRRVELARALATDPDLLFLDEPAAGLNSAEAQRLGATLKSIRDRGITIMLVEHNMSLVMSISDMVCVLDFGRLIAHGTPEHVCQDEGVIKAYLGPQEAKRAS
jgi:branched-chain amino acid transport system permease protein